MKKIRVNDDIVLVKYYPNYKTSLKWYLDKDVCKQVDNRDSVYDLSLLKGMYSYLDKNGDLFYIKYRGKLCGDVSLRYNKEIAIVIAKEFQNKHIGRKVIEAMLELARIKGYPKVIANIYDFNKQSIKCFESIGFKKVDEEKYEVDIEDVIRYEDLRKDYYKYKKEFQKALFYYHKEIDETGDINYEMMDKLSDSMFNKIDNNRLLLLAIDKGEIIGFAYAKIDKEQDKGLVFPSWGYIMEFYVSKEYRRKGIGKVMLNKIEDFFKCNNSRNAWLTSSKIGASFWEACKYKDSKKLSIENNLKIYIKKLR